MKTFYISYFSNKDKKMITRRGKEDDKTKFGMNKRTQVPYFIYFDIDKNNKISWDEYATIFRKHHGDKGSDA